jgi:hypothetical protein
MSMKNVPKKNQLGTFLGRANGSFQRHSYCPGIPRIPPFLICAGLTLSVPSLTPHPPRTTGSPGQVLCWHFSQNMCSKSVSRQLLPSAGEQMSGDLCVSTHGDFFLHIYYSSFFKKVFKSYFVFN